MTRNPAHRFKPQPSDPRSDPMHLHPSHEEPVAAGKSGRAADRSPEEVIRELISRQRLGDAPAAPATSARMPAVAEPAYPSAAPPEPPAAETAPAVVSEPPVAAGDAATPKKRRKLRLPRFRLPMLPGLPRLQKMPAPPRASSLIATRIRGYRPGRKHVVWAAIALVMLWRPLLLPGIAFVTFWILLIVYFTLGPDRVAELISAWWHGLAARRPELAESIRGRAEAWIEKSNAMTGRLPGRWAERFHLPDLSDDGPDADGSDPFERLAAEVRRG